MLRAVGVAFKRVAKSYWFDPGELDLKAKDRVVVATAHGEEIGIVRITPREVDEAEIVAPLKQVMRIATEDDLRSETLNRARAPQVMEIATTKVHGLKLPMRIVDAEFTFDGSTVTIFFWSEDRVDFRELVRELVSALHCRVMLHQIGARDYAKMVAGLGPCGRPLCCATFLSDFEPVSVRMAKDQSLFINPVKFSGLCGKLMCCLRYEEGNYSDTKSRLPQVGDMVVTPLGKATVIALNVLNEWVYVRFPDSGAELRFDSKQIEWNHCGVCNGCAAKEEAATNPIMQD